MYNFLYQYLIFNKKLSIPGIGSFIVENKNATLNFVDKIIYPPLPVINYTAEKLPADKNFFTSLSRQLNVDETSAENKFNEFTSSFTHQISQNGSITLPGIGILTKQFYSTFTFEPQQNIQTLFPEIHAERVVRKNAEHTVLVGESEKTSVQMQEFLQEETPVKKWWVPAAVLAVIGVAALILYYAAH